MTQHDVIIVGAGPTGLTLANLFGQAGINTLVVERLHELINYPRAIGIDDEALRGMQAVRLINEVLPHTVPHHMVRAIDASGNVISEMNPTTDEFGWARRNGFIQPLVDQALLEGLKRYACVEVRLGQELEALEDSDGKVTATLRDVDSDEKSTVSAKYLVGCEGGRSFSRGWIGAEFEGETLSRVVVVDVEDDPIGTPNAIFGADERSWATFGLPHGIRRWEFLIHENETNEEAESDEFIRRLLADHVPDPAKVNIKRVRAYQHNARIASSFHKGRVILAGDAAHIMPVNAGQGWNSCIRDAMNLGWKLIAVLKGRADASLIDTYEIERRDHVKGMVNLSVGMGKAFATRGSIGHKIARRAIGTASQFLPPVKNYLASMKFKPMPRYTRGVVVLPEPSTSKSLLDAHRGHTATGKLFIQPKLSAPDGAVKLMDDIIGYNWTILAWNNDPLRLLSEETASAFRRLGTEFVSAVPEVQREWMQNNVSDGVTVLGDADSRLKKWFDDKPFGLLFIRPDRVVAAECIAANSDDIGAKVLSALSYRIEGE